MKKLLLCVILFTTCEKIDDDGFRVFKINKGEHRSGTYLHNDAPYKINFLVKVTESMIYDFGGNTRDQYDVNKIYGFSDFGQIHQEASIRLGWSYYTEGEKAGELWFRWLKHTWGQHKSGDLMEVEVGEIYNVTIEQRLIYYIFTINGKEFIVDRDIEQNRRLDYIDRYYLYPYFGGQKTAPHDIKIKIKE